jgi:hypothetical protein
MTITKQDLIDTIKEYAGQIQQQQAIIRRAESAIQQAQGAIENNRYFIGKLEEAEKLDAKLAAEKLERESAAPKLRVKGGKRK